MAPPKIASFSKIRNAVIFVDYKPAADLPVFQSKNLIYGFNGTGKTTLTRLLTSVVQAQLDPRLPSDCEFAIKLDDATVVTQLVNVDRLRDVVRVYNSDFIDANFRWAQGQANPVFYIGQEQANLVSELEAKEIELEKSRAVYRERQVTQKNTSRALGDFKTTTARQIENELRRSRTYRAPNLKDDYDREPADKLVLLSDDELQKKKEITGAENPPSKLSFVSAAVPVAPLVSDIRKILATVASTYVLADLEAHAAMEPWVQRGFEYHQKENLTNCLLCANTVSESRLDQLAAAFDDAHNRLLQDVNSAKSRLKRIWRLG